MSSKVDSRSVGLGLSEIQELEEMLAGLHLKRPIRFKSIKVIAWVSTGMAIACFLMGVTSKKPEFYIPVSAGFYFVAGMLAFGTDKEIGPSMPDGLSPDMERMRFRRYLSTLAESREIRSVPLLLLAFKFRGNPYADAHRRRLIALLPQLIEDQGKEFDERHLQILNNLALAESGELQRAVVLELAEVGNGSSLPALEEIVETQFQFDSELRSLALNAIAKIQARLLASRSSAELLRPHLDQDHETLLKPATDSHLRDTETPFLLRAQQEGRGD